MKHELSTETDFKQEGTETALVAFTDHTTKLENLDEKVKAMMSFSEHTVPGKREGKALQCLLEAGNLEPDQRPYRI